jgi:hypothetical protein
MLPLFVLGSAAVGVVAGPRRGGCRRWHSPSG